MLVRCLLNRGEHVKRAAAPVLVAQLMAAWGPCVAWGLSSRTLQRRCHDELSFSWREFLYEARILRSAEFLGQGRHSAGSIAQSIGFSSLSAFTLAFSTGSQRVGCNSSNVMCKATHMPPDRRAAASRGKREG
jgi:hypothetical protein